MIFKINNFGFVPKYIILTFLFLFAVNCNSAVELIVDDPMVEGEVSHSLFVDEPAEYFFSADPNSLYAIVWDNATDGSGTYDGAVHVTVADSSWNKLLDQWSGENMNQTENGYATLRLVASGASSTEYYITVDCRTIDNGDFCDSTFAIQIVSMSKPITLGAAPIEDTITQRTPSQDSSLMTYSMSVNSGITYSVRIDDAGEGPGGYLQDVFHFITYSDPDHISLIDTGAINSYTSPDTFSIGSNSFPDSIAITTGDNVFIWVMLNTYSTSATGYAIEAY
jgi:hypothetical protein